MWCAVPILPEKPDHYKPIITLLDAAFGPYRFGKAVYRLRRSIPPLRALCFVDQTNDGDLRGTIRYWPIRIVDNSMSPPIETPALLLGPIAIRQQDQGTGIGRALMKHSLQHATNLGHKVVILVGDEPYYQRFGFSHAAAKGLNLPGLIDPQRLLGRELVPGALSHIHGEICAINHF